MKKFIIPFVLLLFSLSLADITVNDVSVGSQRYPAVALNRNNIGAIAWNDSSTGQFKLSLQIFNGSTKVGPNITIASSPVGFANVAVSDWDGRVVVAWDDYGGTNYFQIFGPDGLPLTGVIPINTPESNVLFETPAIAIDFQGNFTVAWYKFFTLAGFTEVWARRYDAQGNPLTPSYKVNIEPVKSRIYFKQVDAASDSAGNTVIAFHDQGGLPNYPEELYFYCYDATGTFMGRGTSSNTSIPVNPRVALYNGKVWICWGESDGIYLEAYNFQGQIVKARRKISSAVWTPDFCGSSSGRMAVTWWQNRDGDYDIFALRLDTLGNTVDTVYKVNQEVPDNEYYPAVAVNNDRLLFAWEQEHQYIMAKAVYWLYPALRGNCNGMGPIALDDVIYLVNYILRNGPTPKPFREVGDVNCDGNVTLVDILRLAYYVLGKGPQWTPCGYEIF